MTFKATIFDFNGVLVDDEAVHLAAFRDALEPLGIQVSERDYWDRYIGFDDREGFAHMLADAGKPAPPGLIDALVERKKPMYLERASRDLKGFPGAQDLVLRQALRGPVVVVSGALRQEIEFGLEWLKLSGAVSHIVAAEDTRASKPDPEGYMLAVRWLEGSGFLKLRRDAVVIEDSLAGITAAKAAGLCCVAVGHSHPMQELQASEADLVVEAIERIDVQTLAALYEKTRG